MSDNLLALPQSRFLSQRQIDAFIARMSADEEFHDLNWQIERLKGLGGSEIGVLTKHMFPQLQNIDGESFKTAHDVIDEKLLIKMPMGST